MFSIGWTEFIVLVVVFFVFIEPKEVPLILKKIISVFLKFKNILSTFMDEINQSLYVKEFKKRNKDILKIEKEIKKFKKKIK